MSTDPRDERHPRTEADANSGVPRTYGLPDESAKQFMQHDATHEQRADLTNKWGFFFTWVVMLVAIAGGLAYLWAWVTHEEFLEVALLWTVPVLLGIGGQLWTIKPWKNDDPSR